MKRVRAKSEFSLRRLFAGRHLAAKRPLHQWVRVQFSKPATSVGVGLTPLWIPLCAGTDQERDDLVKSSALGLLGSILPAVKGPAQRRSIVALILHIDRRAAFEQQTDNVGMSSVGSPVQAGLAAGLTT